MKYYYILDQSSRISFISPNLFSNEALEIELETIDNIELGYHGVIDGKIVYIGQTEDELKNSKKIDVLQTIRVYKQLLEDSDWKVIVNSELIAIGLEPKYTNLHQERQAWRDEINRLEEEYNLK